MTPTSLHNESATLPHADILDFLGRMSQVYTHTISGFNASSIHVFTNVPQSNFSQAQIYQPHLNLLEQKTAGYLVSHLVVERPQAEQADFSGVMRLVQALAEVEKKEGPDRSKMAMGLLDGGQRKRWGNKALAVGYTGLMTLPNGITLREQIARVMSVIYSFLSPEMRWRMMPLAACHQFAVPGAVRMAGRPLVEIPVNAGFVAAGASVRLLTTEEMADMQRLLGHVKQKDRAISEIQQALGQGNFKQAVKRVVQVCRHSTGLMRADRYSGELIWCQTAPHSVAEVLANAAMCDGLLYRIVPMHLADRTLLKTLSSRLQQKTAQTPGVETLDQLPVSISKVLLESRSLDNLGKLLPPPPYVHQADWQSLLEIVRQVYQVQKHKFYVYSLGQEGEFMWDNLHSLVDLKRIAEYVVSPNSSVRQVTRLALDMPEGVSLALAKLADMQEIAPTAELRMQAQAIVPHLPEDLAKARAGFQEIVNATLKAGCGTAAYNMLCMSKRVLDNLPEIAHVNSQRIRKMLKKCHIHPRAYVNAWIRGEGTLFVEVGAVVVNSILEVPAGQTLRIPRNAYIVNSDLRGVELEVHDPHGMGWVIDGFCADHPVWWLLRRTATVASREQLFLKRFILAEKLVSAIQSGLTVAASVSEQMVEWPGLQDQFYRDQIAQELLQECHRPPTRLEIHGDEHLLTVCIHGRVYHPINIISIPCTSRIQDVTPDRAAWELLVTQHPAYLSQFNYEEVREKTFLDLRDNCLQGLNYAEAQQQVNYHWGISQNERFSLSKYAIELQEHLAKILPFYEAAPPPQWFHPTAIDHAHYMKGYELWLDTSMGVEQGSEEFAQELQALRHEEQDLQEMIAAFRGSLEFQQGLEELELHYPTFVTWMGRLENANLAYLNTNERLRFGNAALLLPIARQASDTCGDLNSVIKRLGKAYDTFKAQWQQIPIEAVSPDAFRHHLARLSRDFSDLGILFFFFKDHLERMNLEPIA